MNEPKDLPAADGAPADAGLSRLYRAAAGDEPPAALDAAILKAARAAVTQKTLPMPQPWWKRLRAPVTIAATVMLAVMLTLTVDRNPPQVVQESTPQSTPQSARESVQKAMPSPLPAPASAVPADSGASRADHVGAARERMPAAPAVIVDRAEKKAKATDSVPAAPQLVAPPAAMESRGEATTAATGKLENAEGRSGALPERARSADAALAPAPAPAPAMAPAGAAAAMRESTAKRVAPRPEIVWLEEIRSLRRQGREEEAARRLAEFRTAYPDYPLPEDLK
jgi:hypothetical protein